MAHKYTKSKRRIGTYLSPQNSARLIKSTLNEDGTRKDGTSMSKIMNKALDLFYSRSTEPA